MRGKFNSRLAAVLGLVLASSPFYSGCSKKGGDDLTQPSDVSDVVVDDPGISRPLHPFDSQFASLTQGIESEVLDPVSRQSIIDDFVLDSFDVFSGSPLWDPLRKVVSSLFFDDSGVLPDSRYQVSGFSRSQLEVLRDYHQGLILSKAPALPLEQLIDLGGSWQANELSVGRIPNGGVLNPIFYDITPDFDITVGNPVPDIDMYRIAIEPGSGYESVSRILRAVSRKVVREGAFNLGFPVEHMYGNVASDSVIDIPASTPFGVYDSLTVSYASDLARELVMENSFYPQSLQNWNPVWKSPDVRSPFHFTYTLDPSDAEELAENMVCALRFKYRLGTNPFTTDWNLVYADSLSMTPSQLLNEVTRTDSGNLEAYMVQVRNNPGVDFVKIPVQNFADLEIK